MPTSSTMVSMHRIAVLLLEPGVGFDAAIPPMLFGEATTAAPYDVVTCGMTSLPAGPPAIP
ncbi:MAG: hypothetical protein ACSLE6_15870 [Mycobacterium sp.]